MSAFVLFFISILSAVLFILSVFINTAAAAVSAVTQLFKKILLPVLIIIGLWIFVILVIRSGGSFIAGRIWIPIYIAAASVIIVFLKFMLGLVLEFIELIAVIPLGAASDILKAGFDMSMGIMKKQI